MALVAILITSGCVRDQQPAAPTGGDEPPVVPDADLKTCSGLGGSECSVGEECNGQWLDATDSFNCCSQACESTLDEGDILDIDPFEVDPENEELGDLS